MRPRSIALLGALAASLLLAGTYVAWSRTSMQTPQRLSLFVGESMKDVLANNTRDRYNPDKQRDDSPIIWPVNDSVPAVFDMTYNDGSGAVHLPHARMVWASQYAGVVTDILVSASQQKMPLAAVYKELQDAAGQLSRAGWMSSAPLPALGTLEAAVRSSQARGVGGGIMTFQKQAVKAVLELKGFSAAPGNASPEAEEYTLNVRFSDEQLETQQQKKTYDERRQVNGNADDNLTLRYWLQHAAR